MKANAGGSQARVVFRHSVNDYLVTGASWNATLAQRGFQCNLGSKAGTVHRQHVGWRGNKSFGEKVDRGLDTIRKLGASKMEATHNLHRTGDRSNLRFKKSDERTCHVYWSGELLNGILDDVHDTCMRTTAPSDKQRVSRRDMSHLTR